MRPRVLHFIGSFHQGGSERQAVALCRLLAREGSCEIFAATLNREGVLLSEAEAIGLPPIPEYRLTSFFDLNFVKQLRACAAFLREKKIDIVHTHDFYTNVFGIAAARLAGVKCRVASKRETGGMRSRSQKMTERLAFAAADAVVVNAESVRAYLSLEGVNPAKLKLVYNGLDLTRFAKTEAVADGISVEPRQKVVTLVANLRHDVKNVPMLLRAATRVKDAGRPADFVIAGEGELQAGLQNLARELGIAEQVRFIGRWTDVPKLLSDSDICVLTSTAEGFSNSILEYMAAGKPVVATDVGGAGEAIRHGSSGYLVQSDDDATLAERLIELIDDDEKARRLGSEGRAVVAARFSEQAQLDTTLELYRSLLERS
jgi:glycosyltransferase involved in cell wall biosynthesis